MSDPTPPVRQLRLVGEAEDHPPTETPWRFRNARPEAPAGLQPTIVEEPGPAD
jgi:hypothetical protein